MADERGVSIDLAVPAMFQWLALSLATRKARSALSLNSCNVGRSNGMTRLPSGAEAALGPRAMPSPAGRSAASIVSPGVMMIRRSTAFRSSRALPFHGSPRNSLIAEAEKVLVL